MRFNQPRQVVVVDSLPRQTQGKVDKSLLRYGYATLLAWGILASLPHGDVPIRC